MSAAAELGIAGMRAAANAKVAKAEAECDSLIAEIASLRADLAAMRNTVDLLGVWLVLWQTDRAAAAERVELLERSYDRCLAEVRPR